MKTLCTVFTTTTDVVKEDEENYMILEDNGGENVKK